MASANVKTNHGRAWYAIRAAAEGNRAEVRIFGEIGWEVTSEQFIADLDALGERDLDVRISSGGGSVMEGIHIYNRLLMHKGSVEVTIEGIAASMASVIAMAGSKVSMLSAGWLMIHNPAGGAWGESRDHRKTAETLDKVRDTMADAYARRTGVDREQLEAWMDEETWFSPSEALEHGFIDEVLEAEMDMAACLRSVDLSQFTNVPSEMYAMTTTPTKTGPTEAERELERVRQITDLFALLPEHSNMLASCISDPSVTVDDARAKLLREVEAKNVRDFSGAQGSAAVLMTDDSGRAYPAGAAARSYSNAGDDFYAAARDTLALRMGARLKAPHPSAVHGDLARMSVAEMGQLLQRDGQTPRRFFGAGSWFAQPGSDLPAITLDAANVMAASIFEEAERTDQWTQTNSTDNFKPHHRIQSDIGAFPLVRENEEVPYGKLSDKSESNAPATYGKRLALTRQMIVNGDTESIGRLVAQQVRSANATQLDTLYDSLIANPTMAEDSAALFHADHGNLGTGAGSALSGDALADALKAMRKQTGISGRLVGVRPRFLIVPAALEVTARQLINSNTDPSASGTDVANPWKDFLEVIVEPRLDADSETAWYLAAAPSAIDTFEQLFIQGPVPSIESVDNEGGVLGTTWLCYYDHGVAPLEYRGLYKANGA